MTNPPTIDQIRDHAEAHPFGHPCPSWGRALSAEKWKALAQARVSPEDASQAFSSELAHQRAVEAEQEAIKALRDAGIDPDAP